MTMAREYLPRLMIALLALSVVLVLASSQPNLVAASPAPYTTASSSSTSYVPTDYNGSYSHHWGNSWGNWHGCSGYWYYYSSYCSYYYYYPYYSYYYGYPYYNSYYGYPYSSYSSTPSSYTLTVNTNPSNLGTVTGGGSYTSGSSASFSVSQTTVQVSSNTRYVFDHWSGDYSGAGTSGSVTVNNAMTVTAVYDLQYYLTVNAQPQNAPAPQGGGWFNAGTTATVQNGGQTVGDSSSQLVFQGWSVDGAAPQSGSPLSVVMNAPHTATAIYTQQYYLNVQSDQGVPSGSGWYDAGSTATFSVTTPVSTQYGVSIIFNGWTGDLQSSSQSTSVVMNGPKNIVATWRTDSTVLYLTIAAVIVAAVLIVVGVIAFLSRGRGGTQAPPAQATQPTAATPATAATGTNVQQNESNTTHKTDRRRKTTTQDNEQPNEPTTSE